MNESSLSQTHEVPNRKSKIQSIDVDTVLDARYLTSNSPINASRDVRTIDDELALLLNIPAGPLSTKAWSDFDPDPLVFVGNQTGANLAEINSISYALTHANVSHPPYFDMRGVVSFKKKSHGWKTQQGGAKLTIQLKTNTDAVLYSYDIPRTSLPATEFELYIACSNDNLPYSHTRSIDVDIFDDVKKITLLVNGATWYKC